MVESLQKEARFTPFESFSKTMKQINYTLTDIDHAATVKHKTRTSIILPLGNMCVKKVVNFIPNIDQVYASAFKELKKSTISKIAWLK